MLQRIQSVFLALVAVCMILMLFFPVWTSTDGSITLTAWNLTMNEQVVEFPYAFVATLAIAATIIALIEIFKYRNRLLQMKLGALNSLFIAGTLFLAAYLYRDVIENQVSEGEFGVAFWLPLIAMLFNLLANRFIRKDERLVRSADRIR